LTSPIFQDHAKQKARAARDSGEKQEKYEKNLRKKDAQKDEKVPGM